MFDIEYGEHMTVGGENSMRSCFCYPELNPGKTGSPKDLFVGW